MVLGPANRPFLSPVTSHPTIHHEGLASLRSVSQHRTFATTKCLRAMKPLLEELCMAKYFLSFVEPENLYRIHKIPPPVRKCSPQPLTTAGFKNQLTIFLTYTGKSVLLSWLHFSYEYSIMVQNFNSQQEKIFFNDTCIPFPK